MLAAPEINLLESEGVYVVGGLVVLPAAFRASYSCVTTAAAANDDENQARGGDTVTGYTHTQEGRALS